MKYILSIDQSTSGTKALLLDRNGLLLGRADLPHQQKVNDRGWVSHDPIEIYENTIAAAKKLIVAHNADASQIAAIGISNQRETSLIWDRETGEPVADAVVWQCGRAQSICDRLDAHAETIRKKTGLRSHRSTGRSIRNIPVLTETAATAHAYGNRFLSFLLLVLRSAFRFLKINPEHKASKRYGGLS